jgi:predicted short-subunit dehydrogenase-like oxidoreductase (DUF2520 family)
MKVNIIGLGKVGRVLAHLWSRLPDVELTALYHRNVLHADIQAQLPRAQQIQDLHQMPPADLWIIAVSDAVIFEVAAQLAQTDISFQNAVVCHCSGILTAEQLLPLQQKGAVIASCHPILNFACSEQAIANFPGCYVGLEGDTLAIQCLQSKMRSLGAHPIEIPSHAKVLYHLMAVVSGNFVAILLDFSSKCAQNAGIDQETAITLVIPLITSTLNNAAQHSPAEALSGPFARLDSASIQKHMEALQQYLPEWVTVYAQLGKAGLALNPKNSPEANSKKELISKLLSHINET